MKQRLVAELINEYQAEREYAETEARRVHAKIVEKAPLYNRLGVELARIAARCAETGEDARTLVLELRKRAEAQLAEAGYSPSDLAPRYRCEKCADTGYIGIPKRPCACFERRLNEKLIRESGLGSQPGHTFDHFDVGIFPNETEGKISQRERMERLGRLMRKYAEDFPNNETRDYTFVGPSGLGKTFLADCAAARIMERGFGVLRMTAYRMIEALRRHHMGRDEEDIMELLLTVDLLYIDDLGTEPLFQNISGEYLFTLINERQQAKKATLIATNLSIPELSERYTERLTSRLLNAECAAVIPFVGKDIRLRPRVKNEHKN